MATLAPRIVQLLGCPSLRLRAPVRPIPVAAPPARRLTLLARPPPPSRALPSPTPILSPARGNKYVVSLKLRCDKCFFIRRRGALRVVCPNDGRHKQVQKGRKRSKRAWK